MADDLEINAVGMRCPRPIIELAKAARKAAPGSRLSIVADDLAFESDVRAWCENQGASLESLATVGKLKTAVIVLKS